MALSIALLLLGLQTQTPNQSPPTASTPSVAYDGKGFHVRGLGKAVYEPLELSVPDDKATYRKDDAFAVWDSRGLSVRHGQFTMTTRLPEIALTPKLFAKDEIIANRDSMAKGERQKEASALSGSRRIGEEVYFLVRWDDKAGKPWLEALVRVNLKSPKPKPELVGRFPGLTTATGAIDDQLVLFGASPAAFVRSEDAWGLATYNRETTEFTLKSLGHRLRSVVALSPRLALAMEDTEYGKVRTTRIDLVSGARRDIAELPGAPSFVDASLPALAVVPTNIGPALRNLETGAQMGLPAKPVVRRTAAGILIWPGGQPELCAVYSPERFLKLATAAKAGEKPKAEKKDGVEQSKPTKRIPPL